MEKNKYSKRIAIFEFSEPLKIYLQKIENLNHALIIAPENYELIDHSFLWENEFEKVKLLKVDDSHRLPNFKEYLPEIRKFIELRTNE